MYRAKYFNKREFVCPCCGFLPAAGMSDNLLAGLDWLRRRIGRPIYVSSGYRCQTHNTEVGGVANSQHCIGTAADIYADGMTAAALAEEAARLEVFDAIGVYNGQGFIHVDCRNDGYSANEYSWIEQ